MSLKEKLEASQKSEFNSSGSSWFKFKEGKNSIRVLTEPEPFFENFGRGVCYTDCGFSGSAKTLAYILDNADGKVKLMRIPYTISEMIASWQTDEDWAFDSFPMDFDINIDVKGAGTKEVVYSPTPRPKKSTVSDEVIDQVMKQSPCSKIIEKLKEKNIEKHKADGSWQKEQERKQALIDELAEARTPNDKKKVRMADKMIEPEGYEYPEGSDEPVAF